MNRLLLAVTFVYGLLCCESSDAQNFDDYFINKTLRIDYEFAGTAKQQNITTSHNREKLDIRIQNQIKIQFGFFFFFFLKCRITFAK